MKLALILPGGVDRGGVDRVIHSRLWLIERLARRHEVHVFATRQEPLPGDWDLLGAHVHNIGTARGTARRLLGSFVAENKRGRFDVVHAFFGSCGAYAAIVGWRCRVPVIYHPSGGEFVDLKDIHYGMRSTLSGRLALRLAMAGARRVTVATPYMQRLAAAHGVVAELVPLGVALDRWPPADPRPREPLRAARLLHIGDVRPVKDQSMLMRAAAHLKQAGLAFELDIAGLDTMDGFVQRSAVALGLGDAVRWHGVLRHDALRALVDQSDVLLVTSRHEAGPLAVLEAAVAGVPTVGTAVGHVDEWSQDAAIAVPIGDHAAMAREVSALMADEPRRLALAHAAQRRAIAIDADYTAAAFERIYLDITRTT